MDFQEEVKEILKTIETAINLLEKRGFSSEQINEILEGYVLGLSADQVSIYCDPRLSVQQMDFIKRGLAGILDKSGYRMTIEQAKMFANPNLTLKNMVDMWHRIKLEGSRKDICKKFFRQ